MSHDTWCRAVRNTPVGRQTGRDTGKYTQVRDRGRSYPAVCWLVRSKILQSWWMALTLSRASKKLCNIKPSLHHRWHISPSPIITSYKIVHNIIHNWLASLCQGSCSLLIPSTLWAHLRGAETCQGRHRLLSSSCEAWSCENVMSDCDIDVTHDCDIDMTCDAACTQWLLLGYGDHTSTSVCQKAHWY